MLGRVLVGVVCLAACKGKAEDDRSLKSGVMPPTPPGMGSGSGHGSSSASGSGSGSAVKKDVPEDPKIREAYRAGMRKGRKATDAKNWAEAIAGFDEALAAKKADPRALGERGFAKLLEGKDLASATRDLDAAASGTKDPKILSSIWFNRGLIAEKQGNTPNAIAAFVVANTLRPTDAAKKKIAGNTCPVTVERTSPPPLDRPNWSELVKAMPQPEDANATDPGPAPKLPAIHDASDDVESTFYVVLQTSALLRALPLSTHQTGGRCPGGSSWEIVKADADHLHVRGSSAYEGGYTYMCEGKNGDLVECTGADNEVSAGTACLGGAGALHDIVIDLKTGKFLLDLSQPDDKPAKAELQADGVKLSGRGCDRVEKL